jgi:hypothetical protein
MKVQSHQRAVVWSFEKDCKSDITNVCAITIKIEHNIILTFIFVFISYMPSMLGT